MKTPPASSLGKTWHVMCVWFTRSRQPNKTRNHGLNLGTTLFQTRSSSESEGKCARPCRRCAHLLELDNLLLSDCYGLAEEEDEPLD